VKLTNAEQHALSMELAPNGKVWWSGRNALQMGLAAASSRAGEPWAPDELMLISGEERPTDASLAHHLGRTVKAIRDARSKLKVRRMAARRGAVKLERLKKGRR